MRQWSAHYRRNPSWLSTTAGTAEEKTAASSAAAVPTARPSAGPTVQAGTPGASAPRTIGALARVALAGQATIATVSRLVTVRAARVMVSAVVLVAVVAGTGIVSRLVTVRAARVMVSAAVSV